MLRGNGGVEETVSGTGVNEGVDQSSPKEIGGNGD